MSQLFASGGQSTGVSASTLGMNLGGGLVIKLCLTLVTPWAIMPVSSVYGVFQPRILEWVAISFSRGSFQPRDQTQISCMDRQILYH